MDNLLDWLLKKENKKTCRFVGIILFLFYLAFFLGGGFNKEIDGHGIMFSFGWFREILAVLLSISGLLGIILMLAGFSKRTK
ncbi:MAG: hypothetical protein KAV18_04750 [Candidatus Omnitrophica bacterium]|nr:hypothetical protein [Candidatus Omnitrophota bacterium]